MYDHHTISKLSKFILLLLLVQLCLLCLNVGIALTPDTAYSQPLSLKYPLFAAGVVYLINIVCFGMVMWRSAHKHTEAAAVAMSTMILLLPIVYWTLDLGSF